MGEFLAGGIGRGDCSAAGSDVSARVLSIETLVLMVEGIESDHVRPEALLESDCRGSADFDLLSKEKSSKT